MIIAQLNVSLFSTDHQTNWITSGDDFNIKALVCLQTESALAELGIKTGLDLREKATELLISYKEIAYTFLIKCGLGLGQTRRGEAGSDENYNQRGVSISQTFRPVTMKHEF